MTRIKNAQAIANLQLFVALRLDERNRLEKIIANDLESAANKDAACSRLAELERQDSTDIEELERLKSE